MRPHHIKHIVIPSEKIQARIRELVDSMAGELRHQNLLIIGVLRGSFVFLADLARVLYEKDLHPRIDFITLQSYFGGTESTGSVTIAKDCSDEVTGAHILLIDDILDTGRTMDTAVRHLLAKGAERVHTCVLLDKPDRRVIPYRADYAGFEIEDRFVVGYGLDYDSRYRELPYIAEVTFTD